MNVGAAFMAVRPLEQGMVLGSGVTPTYPGFGGVGVLQAAFSWVASDLWSPDYPEGRTG